MLDAIRLRRSVRRYKDMPVEPAALEQLQEAMLRAPSSRNLKPWRFVFVTNRAILGRLAHAKAQYADFIAEAALAVAVCGNTVESDCWIEDCAIAATMLQLEATDLGLGSCWVQIRGRADEQGRSAEERVREILGLGEGLGVLCVVAVGHPSESKPPRDRESLDWTKIESRTSS